LQTKSQLETEAITVLNFESGALHEKHLLFALDDCRLGHVFRSVSLWR
jgi:hypothetical protein